VLSRGEKQRDGEKGVSARRFRLRAREHRRKPRRGGNALRRARYTRRIAGETRMRRRLCLFLLIRHFRRRVPLIVHRGMAAIATADAHHRARNAPASTERSITSPPSSSRDSGVYLFLIEAKRERGKRKRERERGRARAAFAIKAFQIRRPGERIVD